MAAQRGLEAENKDDLVPTGIPEDFEPGSDDDEPAFTPRKNLPTFLSSIDAEIQKEIKNTLSKSVEANENKLTTAISESIATKFKITQAQVQEYFNFLYTSPTASGATGGAALGDPVPISRAETGPGDGVALGSNMNPPPIENAAAPEDLYETEDMEPIIGGPPPLLSQKTTSSEDNECIFGNETETPFSLAPMGMSKKATLDGAPAYGEAISEHVEKDLDDYDAPSFVPINKNEPTFTMAPPVMSAARTGFDDEDEDDESIEEVVEAEQDDPDEPPFSQ